jgi:hypothetical protein
MEEEAHNTIDVKWDGDLMVSYDNGVRVGRYMLKWCNAEAF